MRISEQKQGIVNELLNAGIFLTKQKAVAYGINDLHNLIRTMRKNGAEIKKKKEGRQVIYYKTK